MTKKAATKTAGISMAGFQPRAKLFDGQTPDSTATTGTALPDAARDPGRRFTGVGSVMAAITREAEVSHELLGVKGKLDIANARLATFEGATLVQSLDPASIRRGQWANRAEEEFSTPDFALLKSEITNAGGNVQAIKVRRIPGALEVFDGQTPIFEIVFGHRRHRACLEAGLPVNAVVVENMNDREVFEAMDRENRGRKNLSAWEQGRMYDEALKKGLYPSLRRLSESLGVNLSDAARGIQLAKLPKEIVSAFATPLDLQVRWAKPLADALQRDPDAVLARARDRTLKQAGLTSTEIYERLVGKGANASPMQTPILSGQRKVATLKVDSKGRASVEFEAGALLPNRHDALIAMLRDFCA